MPSPPKQRRKLRPGLPGRSEWSLLLLHSAMTPSQLTAELEAAHRKTQRAGSLSQFKNNARQVKRKLDCVYADSVRIIQQLRGKRMWVLCDPRHKKE